MTPNEYQELAHNTCADAYPHMTCLNVRDCDLLHSLVGITSEAGELADAVKKHYIYGKPLDEGNIIEECGDLLWYIALTLHALDVNMETCMIQNIAKLQKRYPEKFTEYHAAARLDKKGE